MTLRLFAQAREAAGESRIQLEAASVAGVLELARGRFGPEFSRVLDSSRVWLNGHEAHGDDAVVAGDEVAVLPPVSGG